MEQCQLMSESQDFELVSREVGALPIVNHYLDRLKLPALLEKYLPADVPRAQIQPIAAVGILVRNLVLSRVPLYSHAEWSCRIEPSLLDLTPEQVSLINDDRLGRALDRLFDADRSALLTDFVVHMVREFKVNAHELAPPISFRVAPHELQSGRC